MEKNNLHFFLGGADLEMVTIKKLLEKEGVSYSDAKLDWYGANVTGVLNYKDEIEKVAKEGKTPVLIELPTKNKEGESLMVLPEGTKIVDHHNEYADNAASVLQVCRMLGIKETKEIQMIAANDVGAIGEMMKLEIPGMNDVDKIALIKKVRAMDKKAQGVTPEQELSGQRAAHEAKDFNGVTVVYLKGHSKCAPVTDELAIMKFEKNPEKAKKDLNQNEMIISHMPDGSFEVNYFGPTSVCKQVYGENGNNFGGWMGPGKKTTYWGKGELSKEDTGKICAFILTKNQEKQNADKVMAKMMNEFLQKV